MRREKLEEEEEEMGKARERLKVELAEISEVLQDAVEAYRVGVRLLLPMRRLYCASFLKQTEV